MSTRRSVAGSGVEAKGVEQRRKVGTTWQETTVQARVLVMKRQVFSRAKEARDCAVLPRKVSEREEGEVVGVELRSR